MPHTKGATMSLNTCLSRWFHGCFWPGPKVGPKTHFFTIALEPIGSRNLHLWVVLYTKSLNTSHLALWDKWIDVESPSPRFALEGGGPNVVGKAAVLCSSNLARIVNTQSIIRGFVYKGYKGKKMSTLRDFIFIVDR